MSEPNGLTERVLKALESQGPMTMVDLAEYLDSTESRLCKLLAYVIRPTKRLPQRAHITRWTYEQDGQRPYPRAVYAFGPGRNAKRPSKRERRNETKRRRYHEQNARLRTASVFNLGLRLKTLKEQQVG